MVSDRDFIKAVDEIMNSVSGASLEQISSELGVYVNKHLIGLDKAKRTVINDHQKGLSDFQKTHLVNYKVKYASKKVSENDFTPIGDIREGMKGFKVKCCVDYVYSPGVYNGSPYVDAVVSDHTDSIKVRFWWDFPELLEDD